MVILASCARGVVEKARRPAAKAEVRRAFILKLYGLNWLQWRKGANAMGVAGARFGRSDGLVSWQGGRLLRRAGGVELERVELSFGASPS